MEASRIYAQLFRWLRRSFLEGWHNVAEAFYGTPAWNDQYVVRKLRSTSLFLLVMFY
jgi:hypothetical protein